MKKISILLFLILTGLFEASYACTGIRIQSKEGAFIQARTMEWNEFNLRSNLMIVPRGEILSGTATNGQKGASWTAKYGFVAINALDVPIATDGMNEVGLAVGAFYLTDFAEYQPYDPAEIKKTMGSLDVAGYLLSNFQTTDEVRAGLPNIRASPFLVKKLQEDAPLHWLVTDSAGKTIVIEYTNKGKLLT